MGNIALQILNSVPNDLAAYHAMIKAAILNQDFTLLKLFVMTGMYAKIDTNSYDYLPILDIRNSFEKLRIEIFDQSFLRNGNTQRLNLQNCEGKTIEFELSDVSRNLRFPVEFLEKISSTPGLINFRDFMKLPERKFQSKIFSEIDREEKKLTVAGKIFSYEDIEILDQNNVDFFCLGRAAILDHQFPKRLKEMGYNFDSYSAPVSRNHLLSEGLSEKFIDYMSTWKNFVEK